MTTISASGSVYLQDVGSIQYSTDNVNWNTIGVWPVTVINTNISATLIVLFTTNITLTANDQYFVCGSENIQFGSTSLKTDGTRPIITIAPGVINYPGLIQNGTSSANGSHTVSIYNLVVDGTGATLATGGGWIGQQYFAKGAPNNTVVNCSSLGNITTSSGGILGRYTASNSGSITIIGCNSSGNIGFSGGGLIGESGANTNSIININQCFTTGRLLENNAGGIVGSGVGINNSVVTISNCYSVGDIIGDNVGGIVGDSATNTRTINCYSLGNITGLNSGGIFASGAFNCIAQNCYSAGTGVNGIFGPFGSSNTTLNCYAANGSWSDSTATTTLQNIGWAPGKVWGSLATNTPYVLVGLGTSPYTLDNIDPVTKTLVQTFSQTVQAGGSTPAALAANYKTFEIKAGGDPTITIANSPSPTGGVITTTTSTPAGTYTLYIYAVDDYTTTTYTLTVTAAPTPAGGAGAETTVPPCCEANVCNKNPQESNYSGEIIATKRSGKTINTGVANFYNGVASGTRTAYSQPVFKSYYDYIQFLQGKTR